LHESDLWVAHTHEVLAQVAETSLTLKEIEVVTRKYFSMHDEEYLEQYRTALSQMRIEMDGLKQLTRDNESQRERIALFATEFNELTKSFDAAISSPAGNLDVGDFAPFAERIAVLRSLAGAMAGEESDLLHDRAVEASRDYRVAMGANVLAMLLTVGVIVFAWRSLATELEARRAAEQVAYAERERLLTTLTSIGDAVVVTDNAGRVTLMNNVAKDLTRWDADALGRPLDEVFRIVNETTRAIVESPVKKVLREGTIVGLANHTILIARDGSERPIDDSGAPVRDNDGRIVGVVLVFRDVADRRHVEDTLRASEARFRVMAETVPGILYTTSSDGSIDFINRWFFSYTGLNPDQTLESFIDLVVFPDDRQRAQTVLNTMQHTGTPQELKLRCRAADGSYRWFLHRSAMFGHGSGRGTRWLGVCTDIDDLVNAEQSLRDADRRKDQFLAMLAHELRNPLAPISNALELLQLVGNDSHQVAELRDMMERQVQHMIRLIDDLLDLSRVTRGKIALRKQRVDLTTLVNGAVESIEPFIERCGHKLTVTTASEPIVVEADVARLVQVFGNILHNAAKYTGQGGQIDVRIERAGEQATVSIRDNGPGIPPSMLNKIFDMFTQVDQTLDRAHGGLGIGLTLVKTLVDLHGGSVVARSEGPGQGSEFVVSLPALPSDARPNAGDGQGASRQGLRLPPRRILVVDDVPASAKTLAMMLQSIGQDVDIRFDGASALEAVESRRPEIVFLDIAMPGMDGYEVARRIRRTPGTQQLTLIALTGYGQEQDRQQALAAGFNDHVVKPTSLEALEHMLAAVQKPVGQRDGNGPA
jgi:PAS domain S-box-containing protein